MSKYKKFSKLVQEVIKSLSMYSGTSVQIYAEDRIAMHLSSACRTHIHLFDKSSSCCKSLHGTFQVQR